MAEPEQLNDETPIYRAGAYNNSIDKKGNIKWQIYKPAKKDKTGVSVAFSAESADDQMKRPIFVVGQLTAEGICSVEHDKIKLEVLKDSDIHAEIVNIPYTHEMSAIEKVQQDAIVEEICRQLCDITIKTGHIPKTKPAKWNGDDITVIKESHHKDGAKFYIIAERSEPISEKELEFPKDE